MDIQDKFSGFKNRKSGGDVCLSYIDIKGMAKQL